VKRVLGVDTIGRPALLAPELVHLIGETERCGEFDEAREDTGVRTDLKPGDAVRVLKGAYADLVGVFDCPDVQGRIKILLDIFNRRTSVKIDEALVSPA
jgi:transcription antitermination factor NusG